MSDFVLDAVIEIPQGSQNKYEVDHKTHQIRLDRVLHSSFHYPTEYGFLPDTLAEDGDPLDVLVFASYPTFPGCVVSARIIGVMHMTDDKGPDDKLLAVAADDPRFDHVQQIGDLAPHLLKEVSHFFLRYKELEKKQVTVGDVKGVEVAKSLYESAKKRYVEV